LIWYVYFEVASLLKFLIVVSNAVNAAALAGKARKIVGRNPLVKPLTPLFGAASFISIEIFSLAYLRKNLPCTIPETSVPFDTLFKRKSKRHRAQDAAE
jgi:hypothetical protein